MQACSMKWGCLVHFIKCTRGMRDIVGRTWANTRKKHWAVAWTQLSSRCDWDFRPQNDTPKVQTHAQHRNSESVKQSSRYVTHNHMDMLCKTMDNTHVHGKTHGKWFSVHWDEMAWTDEASSPYLSTCTSTLTEWLQHRNCESGHKLQGTAPPRR